MQGTIDRRIAAAVAARWPSASGTVHQRLALALGGLIGLGPWDGATVARALAAGVLDCDWSLAADPAAPTQVVIKIKRDVVLARLTVGAGGTVAGDVEVPLCIAGCGR